MPVSSSYTVTQLGSVKVKEMDSVLLTASNKVATSEIRSSANLTAAAADNVTISSANGNVVLSSGGGPVRVTSDLVIDGALSDSGGDTIRIANKTVSLNSRQDATDANASGSGLLVRGTSYSAFLGTSGATGSLDAISALWNYDPASGGVWSLKGGNLSFSKVLGNGDLCRFTFAILDSGDLVLQRTIGNQISQALSHWESLG